VKSNKEYDYFGNIIRDFMLKDCSSAEPLLGKYEIKYSNGIPINLLTGSTWSVWKEAP